MHVYSLFSDRGPGEPFRGVPVPFGVFVPDGPNVTGAGTSPGVPPSPNDIMYALDNSVTKLAKY